ncbi:hypothetical protein BVI434_1630003 [Burkholderia vietnamiensis]|nr:hypothetical protein BVI434_1630003 [Burkholderia vietnamiensis]
MRPPFSFVPYPAARPRIPGAGGLHTRRIVAIVFGMTAFSRLSLLLAGAPLRALASARLPR